MMNSLAGILRGIEHGIFPPADHAVTVVSAPSERDTCVVGLTGHIVVAADVETSWLAEHLDVDDLAAPLNPSFLFALEQLTGRQVNGIDVMLLAPALTDADERTALTERLTELVEVDHPDVDRPRIRRARRYRDQVHAYTDPAGGMVLTGLGLADRLECALEVPPESRGGGHGRRLARTARALAPVGSHLWAQVTPGNAASLRSFLAAGYLPVGSEALLVR